MLRVLSVLLLVFGAMMLSGLAVAALMVPPSSQDWLAWKLRAFAFVGPIGCVPMAIGTLMCPDGFRVRDFGIAMLGTTATAMMMAYIIGGLFGSNEEVRRLDPRYAMQARDYVLCFVVVASMGSLGTLCVYVASRKRRVVESEMP